MPDTIQSANELQQPVQNVPASVLIFIDPDRQDLGSRIIRGLGMAEQFQQQGVQNIQLACSDCVLVTRETEKRKAGWIPVQTETGRFSLADVLRQNPADLVIADVASSAEIERAQQISDAIFICLEDEFQEEKMLADVLVCPTLLSAPDFENLKLPPSHIARCLHGTRYLCLPEEYDQPACHTAGAVIFAAGSRTTTEELTTWLRLIPNWNLGYMFLYLDCPQEQERQLLEQFSWLDITGRSKGITERLDIIHSAKVIVSFPALQVYEFWARGKAVLLLARNQQEVELCQYYAENGLSPYISVTGENAVSEVRQKMEDLVHNHDLRKPYENQAYSIISNREKHMLLHDIMRMCYG
ncbi:MAG: hypothetical protein ACOX5R_01330 [bacterium]